MESGGKSGSLIPEVIEESVYLSNCSSQAELGTSTKESVVKVNITVLEEGEESMDLLVRRNVVDEGNEGVSQGHMVGISITDETDGGLRINGVV